MNQDPNPQSTNYKTALWDNFPEILLRAKWRCKLQFAKWSKHFAYFKKCRCDFKNSVTNIKLKNLQWMKISNENILSTQFQFLNWHQGISLKFNWCAASFHVGIIKWNLHFAYERSIHITHSDALVTNQRNQIQMIEGNRLFAAAILISISPLQLVPQSLEITSTFLLPLYFPFIPFNSTGLFLSIYPSIHCFSFPFIIPSKEWENMNTVLELYFWYTFILSDLQTIVWTKQPSFNPDSLQYPSHAEMNRHVRNRFMQLFRPDDFQIFISSICS